LCLPITRWGASATTVCRSRAPVLPYTVTELRPLRAAMAVASRSSATALIDATFIDVDGGMRRAGGPRPLRCSQIFKRPRPDGAGGPRRRRGSRRQGRAKTTRTRPVSLSVRSRSFRSASAHAAPSSGSVSQWITGNQSQFRKLPPPMVDAWLVKASS
jgi:hypothetical protein